MSSLKSALLVSVLATVSPLFAAVTLQQAFFSNTPSDDFCNPGPQVTSFKTTDAKVWLYVSVANANAGDALTVDWQRPDGQIYYTTSFDPLPQAGDYCFDASISIAGYSAANYTGTWSARGTWTTSTGVSLPLFTRTFTLTGAAACTYSLNPPSQSVAATQSTGAVAVTTSSTCTWTAISNVAWITITAGSSGTGNGTVTFSVAANTGVARSGTLTIGGQTATVNQAATGGGGGNLLQNGNAESGTGSADCSPNAVPGWTTTSNFSACLYGDSEIPASAPGPTDRGNNFFSGGQDNALSTASQTVNVSSYASTIDAGTQGYTLSGWLGGWDGQDDNATVTIAFRSSSGGSLGTAQIGPSLSADRGGVSGLVQKTKTGTMPAGTRTIDVLLTMTRTEGSFNDAAADNLSLTLGAGGGGGGTCTYSLNPASQSVAATQSTGTVAVTTSSTCSWTAASNVAWITITAGSSGTGNGTVTFSAAANTGAARSGTLTIAGQTATVSQAAGNSGSCNYNVNPSSQTIPPGGGTGLVLINTSPTCSWTAVSNANWITITAGSSGTGSGAVSYTVGANTTGSRRTGTLTIAGQTHTVTQDPAAACTYSLSPTSASVSAAGENGAVIVAAATGCSWTATSNANWITIKSGASGSGNGTVNYTVAANTASTSRSGTLTIAGISFSVTQAAAPAQGSPTITPGGVVNSASFMPTDLAGGAIAQGSYFSIFGAGIGPDPWVKQETYPLQTTFGNVSIKVTQGSTSVDAIPVFVSTTQINAVMPSNAPIGDAQITVSYKGVTGPSTTVKIAKRSFGVYTTAGGRGPGIIQNYIDAANMPLNTGSATAKPGQLEIMWGTGLGPVSGGDNVVPPVEDIPGATVEIYVAGKLARKAYAGRVGYAGVDGVYFYVPDDAPSGCYVPVQVRVDSQYSNIVTMAIDKNGGHCSDPQNPFAGGLAAGRRGAGIYLFRANAVAQVDPSQAPLDLTLDLGVAGFQVTPAGGDLAYNPLMSLPPIGSCLTYAGALDIGSALGTSTSGDTSSLTGGILGQQLDAGTQITVSGPVGTIPLQPIDTDTNTGPYIGLLGGTIPLGEGSPDLPPFLNPGSTVTVTGPGGKDVGPFSVKLTIPTPVTWTNKDQLTAVDRTQGVTFNWSGGDPNSQYVLIGGASTDQNTKASGAFFCFVSPSSHTFTVPSSVLGNLPAASGASLEDSMGAIIFGTTSGGTFTKFTANGLDSGILTWADLALKTVQFK